MCFNITILMPARNSAGRRPDSKIIQKTSSFSKRMLSAMGLLQGGRPGRPGLSHMYKLFIFVSNNPVLM